MSYRRMYRIQTLLKGDWVNRYWFALDSVSISTVSMHREIHRLYTYRIACFRLIKVQDISIYRIIGGFRSSPQLSRVSDATTPEN